MNFAGHQPLLGTLSTEDEADNYDELKVVEAPWMLLRRLNSSSYKL